MKLQRAADGGIAVWTLKLNGLSRAARNEKSRRRREPNPLSIRSICQYVRKWTFRQIEWYRDNNVCYYRLKFFMNLRRFFCLTENDGWLLRKMKRRQEK